VFEADLVDVCRLQRVADVLGYSGGICGGGGWRLGGQLGLLCS